MTSFLSLTDIISVKVDLKYDGTGHWAWNTILKFSTSSLMYAKQPQFTPQNTIPIPMLHNCCLGVLGKILLIEQGLGSKKSSPYSPELLCRLLPSFVPCMRVLLHTPQCPLQHCLFLPQVPKLVCNVVASRLASCWKCWATQHVVQCCCANGYNVWSFPNIHIGTTASAIGPQKVMKRGTYTKRQVLSTNKFYIVCWSLGTPNNEEAKREHHPSLYSITFVIPDHSSHYHQKPLETCRTF